MLHLQHLFITHTGTQVSDSRAEEQQCLLTGDDENALRYVAGYMCCKVRTHFQFSSHPNKDDMMLTVMEFIGSWRVHQLNL